MLSKIFLLVFCLMVLNCSMVSAKATKCYKKAPDANTGTTKDLGEVECKDSEDVCYYYAHYDKDHTLITYSHGCSKASIILPRDDERTKMFVTVNGDPTQVCAATQIQSVKFICKCETDLCNGDDTPIHQEFMKMTNNISAYTFLTTVPTTISSTEASTTPSSAANYPDIDKKIIIILFLVMIIKHFVPV